MGAQVSEHTGGRRSLAAQIREGLRKAIVAGEYEPGARLPSESQLTETHGVSRTVIREALAGLRAGGLVESRQGAGVFVVGDHPQAAMPYVNDPARISSSVELLELRTPVEIEAAGLAALRRSPAQEESIFNRHVDVLGAIEANAPIRQADFNLHLEIARATNNPRFEEFLVMHGPSLIPRSEMVTQVRKELEGSYLPMLAAEHERIVLAISRRDEAAAREAMRAHLIGSQERHRDLLRTLSQSRVAVV
jgi:GntR family transcriptional repressor for pyruvate dehydrogenase complex